MGYQAAPDGSLVLPCGLYQFMSNIEGKVLLFDCFTPPSAPHLPPPPTRPPPIDLICDITGAQHEKPPAFKWLI